jgi:hypothetical protein
MMTKTPKTTYSTWLDQVKKQFQFGNSSSYERAEANYSFRSAFDHGLTPEQAVDAGYDAIDANEWCARDRAAQEEARKPKSTLTSKY